LKWAPQSPYFYDRRVSVAVENVDVVLQGFVAGESDLLDAISIARKAAGHKRLIDDLSIKWDGRR
jgi:osmotically-inducible protein OsmY